MASSAYLLRVSALETLPAGQALLNRTGTGVRILLTLTDANVVNMKRKEREGHAAKRN